MKVRITGAVLAVALLLTGCSGGADDSSSDDVASVVSIKPPQPSSSSAPSSSSERPLIRTDTSDDEKERLMQLWLSCLDKNGAGTADKRKLAADSTGGAAKANVDPAFEARYKQAEKLCANKEPEQVWERAKRLDPAYADKLRDWVTCTRSQGIDAWESDGYLTFESLPPENQMKKVDACQDKAFGRG
ncbi:hypothetical protein AB0M54_06195 [Actinoplanes sp. NPDC051470]|uniref:hypothetical protein n=1 Tax=Actinoplanes sp. NPDC051470 TaxID=3157224 RepID=UPI00342C10F3